jgi:hypothetical protein
MINIDLVLFALIGILLLGIFIYKILDAIGGSPEKTTKMMVKKKKEEQGQTPFPINAGPGIVVIAPIFHHNYKLIG